MRKFRWLIETAAVIALACPFALLPRVIALRAGDLLGFLVFYLWHSRRKIAVENIDKAVKAGELKIEGSTSSVACKSFMNLGRSLVDIIKVYFGLGRGIIDSIEVRGFENYLSAKAKGKGILFITGHCGNWEMTALGFGARVEPFAVIARTQNNLYLNKLIEKARARYGNRIIYKQGALMPIVSELRQNKGIGILMDQSVLPDEGCIIDFLGRPAWTMKIPAILARRLGAAVLPSFIHREGSRYIGTFYPPVVLSQELDAEKAIIEDTKAFSSYIEKFIREHPTEWLWMHRRWKRT
jgi:Kdo2-lipid IVA lauroyltransferase/acyltransferase